MDYQAYFYKKINVSEEFEPNEEAEEVPSNDCFDTTVLNAIAAIVICIFIIGLINNVLACIVILSRKSMHTATNCYLLSLSMSDIFLLVTSTTQEMYNIYDYNHIFSLLGCSLKNWASEMSMNVSVLTIAAFTVERYLAICHPFYAKVTSHFSRAVKILIATWLLAVLCALIPAWQTWLYYRENGLCYMDDYFLAYYMQVSSIVFFIVPMILMTIMYVRIWACLKKSSSWKNKNNPRNCRESHSPSSKNTLKMFVMIVVTYFVCWTPFHVQRMMTSHIMLYVDIPGPEFDLVMCVLKHGSLISYQLTAVIDPIIYSIMSAKFRQAFKDLLSKNSNIARNVNGSKTNTTRVSQYSNRSWMS